MSSPADIVYLSYGVERTEADYVFRIGRPAREFARMGYRTKVLELFSPGWPREALEAGLLILAMNWQGSVFNVLLQRQEKGLPTVMQVDDDFLHLPSSTEGFKTFGANPYFQDMICALIHRADAVQFSSPGLSARYAFMAQHSWLAGNAVDPLPFSPRNPQHPPRLGLVFSKSHGEDLAAAIPLLEQFHQLLPDAEVEILCPSDIARPLKHAGRWLRHLEGVPYSRFLDVLNRWSLLLVPQLDHAFNTCRSDSKWLDAARTGLPCLLPRALPYLGVVPPDAAATYQHLEEIPGLAASLLSSPDHLAAIAATAHSEVTRNRTWQAEITRRADLYGQAFGLAPSGSQEMMTDGWSADEARIWSLWNKMEEIHQDLDHANLSCDALLELLRQHPQWLGLWDALYMIASPKTRKDFPAIPQEDQRRIWPDFLLDEALLEVPYPLHTWPTAWAVTAARALREKNHRTCARAVKEALRLNPYSYLALQIGFYASLRNGAEEAAKQYLEKLAAIDPEKAAALRSGL